MTIGLFNSPVVGRFLPRLSVKGVIVCIALGTVLTKPLSAQQFTTDEIQAALVFNSLLFVSWPEESITGHNQAITVCTLGSGPLINALDLLEGRQINSNPTALEKVTRGSAVRSGCQVLAIGASEKNQETRILSQVNSKPILTVSRLDDFANRGGILELKKFGNRFRLIVNTTSSNYAGLAISSQLLEVVEVINEPIIDHGPAQ